MSHPARTLVALAFAVAGCFPSGADDSPEPLQPGPALRPAWTVPGHWSGVAAPAGAETLYGVRSGELVAIRLGDGSTHPTGRQVNSRLRAGARKGAPFLVSFDPWGSEVLATTVAGERLWSFPTDDGIDDAWPADLNGDGDSEVVVGLNGGGGVLALDAAGQKLWTNQSIGNVWHVTAGPLDGGAMRVLTTSAGGGVHVFSVAGEAVRDLGVRLYATEIRLGDQPFVGGTGDAGSFVATLDPSGWMTRVSNRGTSTGALAARPGIAWVAISTLSGNVYAIDGSTGAVAGAASGAGRGAEVEWAKTNGSPLLLVAGPTGLTAYRVGGSR